MVHTCKFDLLSGPYLSICLPLDLELKVVLKLTNSLTSYACKSGSGGFKIDYTQGSSLGLILSYVNIKKVTTCKQN